MCEYGALTLDDDVYIPQADGTWRKYGDLWAVYREEQDVDPDRPCLYETADHRARQEQRRGGLDLRARQAVGGGSHGGL